MVRVGCGDKAHALYRPERPGMRAGFAAQWILLEQPADPARSNQGGGQFFGFWCH